MKHCAALYMSMFIALMVMLSCNNEHEDLDFNRQLVAVSLDTCVRNNNPLWKRHHDSCLKILAIGNSFTINATTFMPWIVNSINRDSICIARLTSSGSSLQQHWKNYVKTFPDYDLEYSDKGEWQLSDIKTIHVAIAFFDWDIITIQQVSGLSGLYSTYQPYLNHLVWVLKAMNPSVRVAWHYTWAYTPWTDHTEFKNYDYDSEKMYEAIIAAGDKASELCDLSIPAATLIKRMREEFSEVENGFSLDGYHLIDDMALYALSSLWYEVLVYPIIGSTSLDRSNLPSSIDAHDMTKVNEIIKTLL